MKLPRTMLAFTALLLAMIGVSALSYSQTGLFLIAGGSDSQLQLARTPSPAVITACLLVAITGVCAWRYPSQPTLRILVSVLALSWAAMGLGIGFFSDGRLHSYWFIVPIQTVDWRRPLQDPEEYIRSTTICPAPPIAIVVRHENNKSTILTSPLALSSGIRLLGDNGFVVER